MLTVTAAKITIEFVGIIMFTTIGAHTTRHHTTAEVSATSSTSGSGVVAVLPKTDNIEEHTPLIIFPTADLDADATEGWTVNDGENGLSYVIFDPGDKVLVQKTGAQNSAISAPTHLPHLKKEWKTGTSGKVDLQSGYKGPDYPAAKTIFKLLEGEIDGCHPADFPKRIDTEVKLNTNGVLTFKYGSSKKLRLNVQDGDHIVIAHVPLGFLHNASMAAGPHYAAYCAMATETVNCTAPILDSVCRECGADGPAIIARTFGKRLGTPTNGPDTPTIPDTMQGQYASAAPGASPQHAQSHAVGQFLTGFECSNTQWP